VGKGTKVRTVEVNAELRPAIRAYLAARPATEERALFLTRIGTRPTPEAVDDVIAAITRAASLD
jgi:site-specific recombinase XerC